MSPAKATSAQVRAREQLEEAVLTARAQDSCRMADALVAAALFAPTAATPATGLCCSR